MYVYVWACVKIKVGVLKPYLLVSGNSEKEESRKCFTETGSNDLKIKILNSTPLKENYLGNRTFLKRNFKKR